MIRASVKTEDGTNVLLGITEENVRRLKAGHPISVGFDKCGIPGSGQLNIMYGNSETDIQAALERAGLVTPQTDRQVDDRSVAFNAILAENAHVLVATVGLPRSGKTTWCRDQGWPIVCPDAIRIAIHGMRFHADAEPFVWATAKAMVRSLFLAGHNIVLLDATNNTRKRRDEWVREGQSPQGGFRVYYQEIATSAEICVERARAEGDEYIVPVIERMAGEWQPLQEDECYWP